LEDSFRPYPPFQRGWSKILQQVAILREGSNPNLVFEIGILQFFCIAKENEDTIIHILQNPENFTNV
jgi:hypothetical protein